MTFDREPISNGNPMEAIVGFSRAVRGGPFISIGGTAPAGHVGQTVGIGDVARQTRQCIEVINAALEQAGQGLHQVVRTTVILADVNDWKGAIDVRREHFREICPVDTIMAVDSFLNPDWPIELQADAVISDGRLDETQARGFASMRWLHALVLHRHAPPGDRPQRRRSA